MDLSLLCVGCSTTKAFNILADVAREEYRFYQDKLLDLCSMPSNIS